MAKKTQEELDARLAELGGGKLVHAGAAGQKHIKNPAYNPNDTRSSEPEFLDLDVEQWKSPDGATLQAVHMPDGSWDVIQDEPAAPKPATATKPTNVYIGTNPSSGKPSQVSEYPDGHKEYDDTQVPAAQNLTPAQQQTQTAAAQTAQQGAATEQALNNERSWNSQHGYGWVTHADRDKAIREQETQARADKNQERLAAAQEASNQLQRDRLQFDKDKANLPDVKAESRPVNGVQYTQVTRTTPQGQTTIKFYGPDGKEVSALPSTGAASVGGPPMPQIIAGHISEAMTDYHTSLWKDPSLTPEQREKRFAEFEHIATAAQNAANEQQRERESQRNADYNTASTKLTYLEDSTKAALTFTQGLIGKVKAGSGLAGQAFAALMGLQALNMKASGINDLKSTVDSGQLSLNNPMKLAEQTQQIATQVTQAATPTPTTTSATATTTTPSIGQGQDLSTPAVRQTTATAAVPQAAAGASAAGPSLGQGQDASSPNGPTAAATASTAGPSLGQGQDASTPPQPDAPDALPAPSSGKPGATWAPSTDPNDPSNQPEGGRVLPSSESTQPSQYGDAGDTQSRSQQPEWAALAALQQQQQATVQAQPQAQADYSDSPALLHAEAASKPIWAMTEDEYRRYKAAGVPDSVIRSIPGRTAA